MLRIIKIETCKECPHLGHRGGFGSPAYVPTCKKMGCDNKLPYTEEITGKSVKSIIARPTYEIPDHCPLQVVPRQDMPLAMKGYHVNVAEWARGWNDCIDFAIRENQNARTSKT